MLEITFYGNATFSLSSASTTVIVDPYLTDNPECPWTVEEVVERERPDAVCVTHVAFDHVGDAPTLASEHGLPVITEPATAHYLRTEGVRERRISQVVWGMEASVGDLAIRVLEARHSSTREIDGTLVTGVPLSFLVRRGNASAYHMGDTSLFRDLETFGDLYDPDVTLIGVGQAFDATAETDGPVTRDISELATDEAVLAAQWIGSERVVPMHYLPDEREQFIRALEAASDAPTAVPLDPGESVRID